MATWLIDSGTLTDIADAIRAKTGSAATIQVSDLATEITNLPSGGSITGEETVSVYASEAITAGDRLLLTMGKNVKNVDTEPTAPLNAVGISPNGNIVVLSLQISPFIFIFDTTTTPWTKLANPATTPTGQANAIKFNNSGTLCAWAHVTSPFITVYDTTTTPWTKLADPDTLPTNNGRSLSWNSTGSVLVVGHNNSPYITAYNTTTTPWTKLADPDYLPASNGSSVEFFDNDNKLIVGTGTASNNISIYNTTTTPWSRITRVNTGASINAGALINNGNTYLCLAGNKFYEFDLTNNYAELSNIVDVQPTGVNTLSVSRDKKHLFVNGTTSTRVNHAALYSINGNNLTKEERYYVSYPGHAFLPDNKTIITSRSSSGIYLNILDISYMTASKYANEISPEYNFGYASANISSGSTGSAKKVFW